MKIIALIGKDHCGKTTLNIVHGCMLENGKSTCKITIRNLIHKDFSDIVDFKNLKIAFFTMGDYSLETTKIIKEYKEFNVDILILASNTKFVNPIKLIEKHDHQLVKKTIDKTNIETEQITVNKSDSKIIFSLI